ncbi:hypothetical protein GCM10010486_57900 [Nonomuraea roseoviolacea subsp. carminata]
MRLPSLLADWFWRVDAFLGGGVEPDRARRFAAAHPVRLGLISGLAFGGFFVLISAPSGTESAFTWPSLLGCLGGAAVMGMLFAGAGYFGRRQQRHYGYYPHEVPDEPGASM